MINRLKNSSGTVIISSSEIFNGVKYTNAINYGTDWNPGIACMGCLEFKTNNHTFDVDDKLFWETKQYAYNYFKSMGGFVVKSIKKDKDMWTYTCYDFMSIYDNYSIGTIWDNWWNTNQTKNISTLITYINNQLPSSYPSIVYDNLGTLVNAVMDEKRFYCTNTTLRQLVAYIAQAQGGFAYVNGDGDIEIRRLGTSAGTTIGRDKYKSAAVESYITNAVTGIWAGPTSDTSAGVKSSTYTDTNVMKIVGNPFFFNSGDSTAQATLQGYLNTIYSSARPSSYTPYSLYLFGDMNYELGDKISFSYYNGSTTEQITSYIFEIRLAEDGVHFSSTGTKNRDKTTNVWDNINGINTATSSLVIENDNIRSQVSDLSGQVSTIDLKVDSIDLSVTNSGTSSHFTLTAEGATLSSGDITMTGKVNNSDLTSGNIGLTIGGTGASGLLLIKDSSNTTRVNLNAGTNTYTLGGWTINATNISRTKTRSGITYTNKLDGLGMEFDLTHDSTDTQTDVEGRQVTYSDYPTYANDAAIEINTPILYINHHAQNGTGTTNLNDAKIFLNGKEFTGGGGGTSDYTQLTNKPQINGVTLTGNKTTSDLGIVALFG